jgi:FlaA1/EpsC-like NDP-sugar epimerase
VKRVIVAIPRAGRNAVQSVFDSVPAELGVRFQSIAPPPTGPVVAASAVVDMGVEDLLGRDEVRIDRSVVGAALSGRRVLITGAGGSIGGELSRQIHAFAPSELLLLDHHENALFRIDHALAQHRAAGTQVRPVLGSIGDPAVIDALFATLPPDFVFHAAAFKHVPLLETQAPAALRNNLLGSLRILEAAARSPGTRLVAISTDKAVEPTNVMGISKRLVELAAIELRRAVGGRISVVRFGNVAGSSGSAIELFSEQVRAGRPLTITDPAMTRYFMTIPEAVTLVLQAGAAPTTEHSPADVYVLDMGEPVNVMDMARRIARLLRPDVGEWPVEVVGTRPGERIHELLRNGDESDAGAAHRPHEKVMAFRSGADLRAQWESLCALLAGHASGAELAPILSEARRRADALVAVRAD